MRYYIHVGDTTTSNGRVVSGLATHTWQGHACAFEGDAVSCPACKSVGVIRCTGTRVSSTGSHGKEEALDGDLCICHCRIPPRLVASQSTYGTTGDAGSSVVASSVATAIGLGRPVTRPQDTHDGHFQVIDEASGKPAVDHPYRLVFTGGKFRGRTDGDGCTVRVSGEPGDTVHIEIDPEGA